MIIELEINGARVIISGDNLTVNLTEDDQRPKAVHTNVADSVPTPVQIIALRRSMGFNQTHFAGLVGVTQASVCRWERGHERPGGSATLLLLALMKSKEAAE